MFLLFFPEKGEPVSNDLHSIAFRALIDAGETFIGIDPSSDLWGSPFLYATGDLEGEMKSVFVVGKSPTAFSECLANLLAREWSKRGMTLDMQIEAFDMIAGEGRKKREEA